VDGGLRPVAPAAAQQATEHAAQAARSTELLKHGVLDVAEHVAHDLLAVGRVDAVEVDPAVEGVVGVLAEGA
jgi:hypothetical protein